MMADSGGVSSLARELNGRLIDRAIADWTPAKSESTREATPAAVPYETNRTTEAKRATRWAGYLAALDAVFDERDIELADDGCEWARDEAWSSDDAAADADEELFAVVGK